MLVKNFPKQEIDVDLLEARTWVQLAVLQKEVELLLPEGLGVESVPKTGIVRKYSLQFLPHLLLCRRQRSLGD